MFVSLRALASVTIGVALTVSPAMAFAAEPPTAPALCTADQERSADGDRVAVAACHQARIDSASARYAGIPLPEDEKLITLSRRRRQ